MIVLGIETSCDDTSIGIVRDGRHIIAESSHSQVQTHDRYGGIVPELAAREHYEHIDTVIFDAMSRANMQWSDIDRIAVTYAPGLMSSLMTGVTAAKILSKYHNIPLVGVHHLRGHICSLNLHRDTDLTFPLICLLVSGGHSQVLYLRDYQDVVVLGQTLDDSAGEAFDKVARLIDLPYPGGPHIDAMAQAYQGDVTISLPTPKVKKYDMSYSGLKTATLRLVQKLRESGEYNDNMRAQIAYKFQSVVVSDLLNKLKQAVTEYDCLQVAIVGGVSANTTLRQGLSDMARDMNIHCIFPDLKYCMDNGAMIASAGYFCPDMTDTFGVMSRLKL